MSDAFDEHFADLTLSLPCCMVVSSLNELEYQAPAGFARFTLEARNPNADIEEDQVRMLEEILGCKLRKVWRRV
jgi:hypothetical protein